MKTDAFIFDIDGTLANNEHRLHYILEQKPKDYQRFYDESSEDTVFENVALLCRLINDAGYPIIMLTGRSEEYRQLCIDWFKKHNIPFTWLFMRTTGDFRTDETIKEEIFKNKIEPHWNIKGVFEDRNRCVEMWRRLGVTCYQPKVTE